MNYESNKPCKHGIVGQRETRTAHRRCMCVLCKAERNKKTAEREKMRKEDPVRWAKRLEQCRTRNTERYRTDPIYRAKVIEESRRRRSDPIKRAALNAKKKQDRQDDPRDSMISSARQRAIKKQVPFTITWRDIEFPLPLTCPVLGIELKFSDRGFDGASPSLDRIIPELGYVPGNIVVISNRANRLKSDGTLEEHRALVKWLESVL